MPRKNRPKAPSPDKSRDPELDPQPGSPPKRMPSNPVPLSDDGLEAAKKQDAEAATGAGGDSTPRSTGPSEAANPGSGGDPGVESGRDRNDPEQPDDDLGQRPM